MFGWFKVPWMCLSFNPKGEGRCLINSLEQISLNLIETVDYWPSMQHANLTREVSQEKLRQMHHRQVSFYFKICFCQFPVNLELRQDWSGPLNRASFIDVGFCIWVVFQTLTNCHWMMHIRISIHERADCARLDFNVDGLCLHDAVKFFSQFINIVLIIFSLCRSGFVEVGGSFWRRASQLDHDGFGGLRCERGFVAPLER